MTKKEQIQALLKIKNVDLSFFPTNFKNKYIYIQDFKHNITDTVNRLLIMSEDEKKDKIFDVQASDFIKIVAEAYNKNKYVETADEKCELELFQYQKKIIDFLKKTYKAILEVGMGLGKTAAVLHYINEKIKLNYKYTVLIVAPKSVADVVWTSEAEKWKLKDVRDKMILCAGSKDKRREALTCAAKTIKIIGRDNVADVIEYANIKYDLVIFDELTSFKNVESKRTEAAAQINGVQYVGLTGTLVPNGEVDLYGQAAVVHLYEYNIRKFYAWRAFNFNDKMKNTKVKFHKWELSVPLAKILNPLKPYIFSLDSADYLDIPPVREISRAVVLSEKEYSQYTELVATLHFNINDINIAIRENAKLSKLQQLCNDFIYKSDEMTIRGTNSTKLHEVCDFLQDCYEEGEKVLLFYAYVEERDFIESFLKEKNIVFADTHDKNFVEKCNNGEVDCLLAHPASAGHGLNLQRGGHIIVWSTLTYNYEFFAQANARLARTGQTRSVSIYYFFTINTVEEHILRKLREKEKENQKIINFTK